MQADKTVNTEYNENDYLTSKIEEKNMIVNDNIVTVDGWKFQIDRSIPKIGSSLGKGETITITAPYIGTTSFTTKIEQIYNEKEAETFTYIIDGEEIVNLGKEYKKEGLEPESKHKVKVIIKYKDGTTLASNTLNIALEPRTYIYNNGDQCVDITGGWKVAPIGCENGVTVVTPKLTFNEDNMNLYLDLAQPLGIKIEGGSLIINNNIDYTNYKKICIKLIATLGRYNEASSVELWANSKNPEYIYRFVYENAVTTKTTYNIDIGNIENIEDIFFYIQDQFNGTANCNIYEVWLEK